MTDIRADNQRKIKINITPTSSALSQSDPVLHEMIRYIKHFLGRPKAFEIAQHAALIYLAVMTAFQDEGLLELEWVPALAIDVGEHEFEITLPMRPLPEGQEAMDLDQESSSRDDDRHRHPADELPDMRAGTIHSKVSLFLGGLLRRGPDLTEHANALDLDDRKPGAVALAISTSEAIVKLSPTGRLAVQCRHLDSLAVEVDNVSIAVNHCYWALGRAYRDFSNTVVHSAKDSHSRTHEREVFKSLCTSPEVQGMVSSPTAQSRLRKRLQRARKFVLLVDIFGEVILSIVPEICVSRLDRLRLEDLQRLATGSVEQKAIAEIKERLQSHQDTASSCDAP